MVKSIANQNIKLSRETQRNVVVGVILLSLLIVYLFDIIWSPLLFMFYTIWIVMNPGKSLTGKEMIGLFAVVMPFLFYCMSARLAGMTFGIIIIVIWEILYLLLLSSYKKVEAKGSKIK